MVTKVVRPAISSCLGVVPCDFSLKNLNDLKTETYKIPIGKTQVEAIKIIDNNNFWITSEDEKNSKSARLMKIKL